LAGTRTQDQRL